MVLEKSLEKIKEVILNRYKSNLAGILVLGSANTGNFIEGESDINIMIFVKEQNDLDFEEEIKELTENLSEYRFQSQYFHSLDSIKQYIKDRKSFATYLVITSGDDSKTLYSTPEFEEMRKWFKENPPTKEELKEHIKDKDEFEIEGYMLKEQEDKYKDRKYRRTQNLLFHLRRKIQLMSFITTGKLIFDFNRCLENINLSNNEKTDLKEIYNLYRERKPLSEEQEQKYLDIAKKFTNKINEM